MRDEQLRQELADWLRPFEQAPPPDLSVIRRRLRRRRARNAAAGAALCALAAGAAVVIQSSAAPNRGVANGSPGPTPAPACSGHNLHVGWGSSVAMRRRTAETPPAVYLLKIRNTGSTQCSLTGWPALTAARPALPAGVTIHYGTTSVNVLSPNPASRVVKPTRVLLPPGASAAAAVTVSTAAQTSQCVQPARWWVTPPHAGASALLPPPPAPRGPTGATGGLAVCPSSAVVVSPVYPAAVPVGQNYPRSPSQPPASVSASPPVPGAGPAAAPYFVVIDRSISPPAAVVRDWRTGRVTAVIQPPAGAPQGFTGAAAAGDDRTFVLEAGAQASRFYQLVLGSRGTPAQALTPLPVPAGATQGTPFAVSDDGSQLALALPHNGSTAGEITVVSLVTGATRTWQTPEPGLITALSWADPGSSPARGWAASNRLAFEWANARPSQAARRLAGLRLLNTAAPGSSLLSSRLLIPGSVRFGALKGIISPLISAGGNVVFATMTSQSKASPLAAVVEFDAATGQPLRVVAETGEPGMGTWCGALWADPSGRRALAACRTQGEMNSGGFTPLDLHFPAPNWSGGGPGFDWFAW
jgi:hypothetical protein